MNSLRLITGCIQNRVPSPYTAQPGSFLLLSTTYRTANNSMWIKLLNLYGLNLTTLGHTTKRVMKSPPQHQRLICRGPIDAANVYI